ncbi:MAG TPA: hypothetical protein VFQ25_10880 [Ktedonobacterales bacterium]|nr:hypothetical protein [Ktedonobacterales bacterium]
MGTNFNDEPTDPDVIPQPPAIPPLGPTVAWDPNATRPAGGQLGQASPYSPNSPTIPYPGPYAPPGAGGPSSPPTITDPLPPYPPYPPATQPRWVGFADPNAPTVVSPLPAPLAPRPAPRAAARPAPRTRPVVSAPRAPSYSAPNVRIWRLLPAPHILLFVGLILLFAALNIPWGATAEGTLLYAQSFQIPFLSDQPDASAQFAQSIVTSVAVFSLGLAGMNYLLTGLNWLARPLGMAGCATVLLMPLMLGLMFLLLLVDGSALVFGAFDPLVGVALAPWQPGFTLNGAHAELGYYAWYTGVILNAAGMLTQPFVKR